MILRRPTGRLPLTNLDKTYVMLVETGGFVAFNLQRQNNTYINPEEENNQIKSKITSKLVLQVQLI